MTKTTKIIIGVVVAVVVVVIIYFLFRSSGNKYASADSISKAKSGSYGKWSDNGDGDWFGFLNKVTSLFGAGGNTWAALPNSDNQAYASAWLKGMDVSRRASNLETFKDDIQKYISSSFKKPDWDITVGSFLNATATA